MYVVEKVAQLIAYVVLQYLQFMVITIRLKRRKLYILMFSTCCFAEINMITTCMETRKRRERKSRDDSERLYYCMI